MKISRVQYQLKQKQRYFSLMTFQLFVRLMMTKQIIFFSIKLYILPQSKQIYFKPFQHIKIPNPFISMGNAPLQGREQIYIINLQQQLNQPIQQPPPQEQYFLVPINQISLTVKTLDIYFIWFQQHVYDDEHVQHLNNLFPLLQIDEYNSFQPLKANLEFNKSNKIFRVIVGTSRKSNQSIKYLNNLRFVDQIYCFTQNYRRYLKLQKQFHKIKGYGGTQVPILNEAIKPCHFSINCLFSVQDDLKTILSYHLNYMSIINHQNQELAKAHLIMLAQRLYPQQNQLIQTFRRQYMIGVQANVSFEQCKNWVFRDCFYWKLISELTKVTIDPRKLSYVRLIVKHLYNTILKYYRQGHNLYYDMQKKKNKIKDLFIICELTKHQQHILKQNIGNYLTFPSFIKGYTSSKKANNRLKQLRTQNIQKQKITGNNFYLFDVSIPEDQFLKNQFDSGYLIENQKLMQDRENIIFNIGNYFQLTSYEQIDGSIGSTINLKYGARSSIWHQSQRKNARNSMSYNKKRFLRFSTNLQYTSLIPIDQKFVLKHSGFYNESLSLVRNKLQSLAENQFLGETADTLRLEEGQLLMLNGQYQQAMNSLITVNTERLGLIAKVKMLQVLVMDKQYIQAQQIVNQINLTNQVNGNNQTTNQLERWGYQIQNWQFKHFTSKMLYERGQNLPPAERLNDARLAYRQTHKVLSRLNPQIAYKYPQFIAELKNAQMKYAAFIMANQDVGNPEADY